MTSLSFFLSLPRILRLLTFILRYDDWDLCVSIQDFFPQKHFISFFVFFFSFLFYIGV